jgi:hypothetical protein
MRYWFIMIVLVSCQQPVSIHTTHDPVIQVDAVFFTGKPMPVIRIRESISVVGNEPSVIPINQLDLHGAVVELTWNGQLISVNEDSAGYYRPISPDTVRMGDRIHVRVQHDGREVSAIAHVPDYPVDLIAMSVDADVVLQQVFHQEEQQLMWTGTFPLSLTIPFVPAYTAAQWVAENEEDIAFQIRYGSDIQGTSELRISRISRIYFPLDEKPEGEIDVRFKHTVIIPEPIYATYARTRSTNVVPVAVTNVNGGVGLFIGAIRHEWSGEKVVRFID